MTENKARGAAAEAEAEPMAAAAIVRATVEKCIFSASSVFKRDK